MNDVDIDLPEVQTQKQIPRFYKQDGKDYVEISYTAMKDTNVSKVKPEHMAQFKAEWDAYCDGRPMTKRPGTPLTDLKSINQDRADNYIARNVHNLEELAALNDGQCQNLGHGTLTDRENAKKLLMHRGMQRKIDAQNKISEASAKIVPAPAEPSADMSEVNAKLDALTNAVTALVQTMSAKPKRGRPKKDDPQE